MKHAWHKQRTSASRCVCHPIQTSKQCPRSSQDEKADQLVPPVAHARIKYFTKEYLVVRHILAHTAHCFYVSPQN